MPSNTTSFQPHSGQPSKLFYIDNIKVLLTILVILHHTLVTYGAPGGWYYTQKATHIGALLPMTLFVSINQSFFMGSFFMLSAYFTPPSYDRKGAGKFIADRLIRLGIPLLFYSFIFSPLLSYMVYYFAQGRHITYFQYLGGYNNWIEFGVMWFVAALLVFTMIYVVTRRFIKTTFKSALPVPTAGVILLFAVLLGVISFLVRILFPVGWVLKPLGFQLGHFPQYIALFIVGLLAYRNQWFNTLSERTGKRLALSAWLCLLFFPVFFIIKLKLNMPIGWYSGGLHWQSLLYAVWEQWVGLSILTALLSTGKRYWNSSSPLLGKLARCSYGVYILHPLAIISLSLSVRTWSADPAIKLLLVAPLAVLSSFLIGALFVLIPGVKKII
ncbi:acyltransferase family protein [Mucilaginibacter paludis]|uniref:Acyltransferase 3 n=1 Tax=Mucilaginibacter paludis DSM 18603 TaxID=714943 RepID=H1YIZ2_9SPHI|nr:acyltransferase [Mucilaginibacter paludis]EHQ27687.1 acyltransferase 3 [Mucilaginibacter paludis DSM 18603]